MPPAGAATPELGAALSAIAGTTSLRSAVDAASGVSGSTRSGPGGGDGEQHLAAGTRFGPYRIERVLGVGGMGVVYRAIDESLDRPVALKLMKADLVRRKGFKDRFLREAKAAAKVQHQHVVTIYASGEIDGILYMAFEYVGGGDLEGRLRSAGPLPPKFALQVAFECAKGLQAIHAKGLVHRDIKPQNVFLDEDGRAKLGDFGLARDDAGGGEEALTVAGQLLGTPAFMAPEQARGGAADADIRADIHAIGATLYAMLTGRAPYSGATAMATALNVLTAPVPDLRQARSDLPEGVCELVSRAMAKEPAARYQTPAELLEAIRNAYGTGVVATRPVRRASVAGAAAPSAVTTAQATPVPTSAASDTGTRRPVTTAVVRRPGRTLPPGARRSPSATNAMAVIAVVVLAVVVVVLLMAQRNSRRPGAATAASPAAGAASGGGPVGPPIAAPATIVAASSASAPPTPAGAAPPQPPPQPATLPAGRPAVAPTPAAAAGVADRFQAPPTPWAVKRNRDVAGVWAMVDAGAVEYRMRWCPPGGFQMGSAPGTAGAGNDEVAHAVELTRGLWIGEHECTQALWQEVMGANPSSHQWPARPVDQVSWDDCQDFIRRLNARIPKLHARLPSEAEWEYACRAGGAGPPAEVAAWCAEDGGAVHPIKHRRSNDWGLFDILGNVAEWCSDGYRSDYQALPRRDPHQADGDRRVVRGGASDLPRALARPAARRHEPRSARLPTLGFRLAADG